MTGTSGSDDTVGFEAGYRALREGAGAVVVERDVIVARGADAEDYLQGQLSQDVAALAPGESAWSLLLRPDGKLLCRMRVTRRDPECFICDMETGIGEAALARLERFKLRVAMDLRLLHLPMLAVRGPHAPPPPTIAPAGGSEANAGDDTAAPVVVAPVRWGSVGGWDHVAAQPTLPPGVLRCDSAALEAVRIEAGVPVAGRELLEGMIPAEAPITDDSVSFTKGCYVGQELVARIDSRGGNTPRRLHGVLPAGPAPLEPAELPMPLLGDDGREVGRVTSSAYSPTLGCAVGLAFIARRVTPPATVHTPEGRVVQIRTLPLVP